MNKAIRIHQTGGPSVMLLENCEARNPEPGELLIRHVAISVNYIDTYHRSGLYPVPLPSGLGLEASGTVEAIGPDVTGFRLGDRVAYGGGPLGAYAETSLVPAGRVALLPDAVSHEQAAAIMLKGMTARYLLKETYPVQPGETILFHAAAGGVGLLVCQWARDLGVTVIGTASTQDKCDLALKMGATHMINSTDEDIVARVREITDGHGVPVVYDGVGKDTFETSLDCLQPRGLLASFGNASGPVTNVDLGILTQKGSLYVTRPSLGHYTATEEALAANTADVFDAVARGALTITINQRHALEDAVMAHEALESRRTTGASILVP